MTITVGSRIPDITVQTMGAEGPEDLSTGSLFAGKTVVLFGLPGAFTPTCSNAHVPGFVVQADAIKAAGVDTIACMSVNDAFVMSAWGKSQNAEELLMIADGNADFATALGLEMDLRARGFGIRCQRFAAVVEDGVVTYVGVEPAPGLTVSSAESVLAFLTGS